MTSQGLCRVSSGARGAVGFGRIDLSSMAHPAPVWAPAWGGRSPAMNPGRTTSPSPLGHRRAPRGVADFGQDSSKLAAHIACVSSSAASTSA